MIWGTLWQGELAEAEHLTKLYLERESEANEEVVTVMQRALQNPEKATELFEAALTSAPRRQLEEWSALTVPVWRLLAAAQDVVLPPLEGLDALRNDRLRMLKGELDPVRELSSKELKGSAETVQLTRLIVTAQLELARGEPVRALSVLASAGTKVDDPEIRLVEEFARERATVAAAASESKEEEESEVLRSPADGDAGEPEWLIQVVLPPSWFDGHENPVNSHALFLRYLPEARVRTADNELPPVRVSTEDGLEPDRYNIILLGETAEEGRVGLHSRYTTRDALGLLGPIATRPVPFDEELRELVDATNLMPIGFILSMEASEVVARRIENVWRKHSPTVGDSKEGPDKSVFGERPVAIGSHFSAQGT